ncbi:hypothetical protein pb186bvf_008549 [Paramecium bursaria]
MHQLNFFIIFFQWLLFLKILTQTSIYLSVKCLFKPIITIFPQKNEKTNSISYRTKDFRIIRQISENLTIQQIYYLMGKQSSLTNRNRREYIRINQNQRTKLVDLVFRSGVKIKDAALIVQMKYATAKTIVYYYRKQKIRKPTQSTQSDTRCQYNFNPLKFNQIQIITQIAGGTVYQNIQKV